MSRIKIDIKPCDRDLLDELAETIGISRTEANSLLIKKCGRHLIQWLSQDFCQASRTAPATPSYSIVPTMPTNLEEPLDL